MKSCFPAILKRVKRLQAFKGKLGTLKGFTCRNVEGPEQGRACAHSGVHRPANSLQPRHCSPGFIALRAGVSLGARAVGTVS